MEELSQSGLFCGERGFGVEERSDVFQSFTATGDATHNGHGWVVLFECGEFFQHGRLTAPHFLPQLFGSPLEIVLTLTRTDLLQLNPSMHEPESLT
jgi:hypothetical protein